MSALGAIQVSGADLSEVDILEVSSNILCEFLEVAFHLILYIRELYPPVLFERRRKYNVPVHMCVHPELSQYFSDVLTGLRALLKEGKLEKVWLSVKNKDHLVVERFMFEMKGINTEALNTDVHLLQLERDLRAMLLKISVCDALLSPLPPDCTCSVEASTDLRSAEVLEHQQSLKGFPWVTADHSESPDLPDPTVLPLKSVSSSILQMQLCVEESILKSKEL